MRYDRMTGEPLLPAELERYVDPEAAVLERHTSIREQQQPSAWRRFFAAKERLDELDVYLRTRITGQDHVIAAFMRKLKASLLLRRKGPLGIFIFGGLWGTGKTEIPHLLAEFLTGSRGSLTLIEGNKIEDEHYVATMIGAPPGYVGSDRPSMLARATLTTFPIVVIDEIDKIKAGETYDSAMNALLNIFENGTTEDSECGSVSFSDTFIFLTSNHGASQVLGVTDPLEWNGIMEDAIRKALPPAIRSRTTGCTIIFNPLTAEAYRRIVQEMITALVRKLRRQGVRLAVRPAVTEHVLRQGRRADSTGLELGARVYVRTVNDIEDYVHTYLADIGRDLVLDIADGRPVLSARI